MRNAREQDKMGETKLEPYDEIIIKRPRETYIVEEKKVL